MSVINHESLEADLVFLGRMTSGQAEAAIRLLGETHARPDEV